MPRYGILTALTMSALVTLPVFAGNKDWAGINRYQQANKEITAKPDVVFIGNSITDYWIDFHPDFFASNNYLDRGIGGQTSSQMLLRFREDVIKLNPEVVVINAGTNDCAENTGPFDADFTFDNIVSMAELAKANGIKVILASILPASSFGWNPNVTDAATRIADLNSRIKEYALANGIPFADYYTPMVYGNDLALNPSYSNDGVHPTAEGYVVMESVIKPIIEKTLKP